MPLGNLTSQFFANVYLNELDKFVKHKLKVKYYLRYVDDFVILHKSKKQLKRGVDFVGFRNFYHHKLLRKRNVANMKRKINLFNKQEIDYDKFIEIFQGWKAYASWADSKNIINKLIKQIKP